MSGLALALGACGASTNTGAAGCKFTPKLTKYLIAIPEAKTLDISPLDSPEAVQAAVRTWISDMFVADALADRAQLIGQFTDFTDNSEAVNFQTLGYGASRATNDGTYKFMFMHQNKLGAHNLYRQLNGKESVYKFLIVDDAGNLYNAQNFDTTGKLIGIKGISLSSFYAEPRKLPNYTEGDTYPINISIASSAELNELSYVVALGSSFVSELPSLAVKNVTGVLVTTGIVVLSRHQLILKLVSSSSGESLGEVFGSDFLTTPENFIFTSSYHGEVGPYSSTYREDGTVLFEFTGADWHTGAVMKLELAPLSIRGEASPSYGYDIAPAIRVVMD